MTIIQVEKLNEVHLRVYSDDMGVESELSEFFTYEFPGAKYTPKFRARLWDGKIRLYDSIRKTLYCGLYGYLEKFCSAGGYELEQSMKHLAVRTLNMKKLSNLQNHFPFIHAVYQLTLEIISWTQFTLACAITAVYCLVLLAQVSLSLFTHYVVGIFAKIVR